MNQFRDKALTLRRKNHSYNAISKKLGIPKSTLSYWLKNEGFSLRVKEALIKSAQKKAVSRLRLMALANKEKWVQIHSSYREKAKQEFPKLISTTFFSPGLVIYWGEGDKKVENGIVRVSNIDYRLLKTFIAFLVHSCVIKLEKVRAWLLLYPDLNERMCKKYWSRMLGLPQGQFIKSQYIKGRERSKRVNNGVCTIQIYSREVKEKIVEWINLYSQKLENAGMV